MSGGGRMKPGGHYFKKGKLDKSAVLVLLIVSCIGMMCYFTFVRRIHLIYTHFFYIPIVFSGFFWGRKSIWVAVILGICLLLPYTVLDFSPELLAGDILRAAIFVVVAAITGSLREYSLYYDKRFSDIIERNPIPTFVIDKDHTITHFNSACEVITGFSAKDMIGTANQWMLFYKRERPVLVDYIVDGADPKDILEEYKDIKLSSAKDGYEGEAFSKNMGENGRWIYVNAAPIKYADGEIIGAIQTMIDITDQKKAENELSLQKAYFQQLFENSPEAIVMLDNKDRAMDINREFEEIFQYSLDEIKGCYLNDIIVPGHLAEEASVLSNAVFDGKVIRRESIRMRKDGSLVNVSILGCPIIVNNEQVGIYGIYRDITAQKLVEQALQESEERYRKLFELSPDSIYVHTDGIIVFANPAAAKLLGVSSPDELVGKPILDFMHPDFHEIAEQRMHQVQEDGRDVPLLEERLVRADRTVVDTEVASISLPYEGMRMVLSVFRDITERKRAEREINLQKAYFQQLFENSPEAIAMMDNEDRIININREFHKLFQYSIEEIKGCYINDIIVPEHLADEASEVSDTVIRGDFIQKETVRKRKDGSYVDVSILRCPIVVDERQVGGYVIYRDITERKRREEIIKYQACHDILTGLPNRVLFNDHLAGALADACNNSNMTAVMFLDLDKFKNINDTLGHAIGDELLIEVGRRLKGLIRQVDIVARMGGDEFTILLPGISGEEEITKVAQRIIDAFHWPFTVQGRELYITTSIGISVYPVDGGDVKTLLKNADIAMYRAKEMGRNNFQFFASDLSSASLEHFSLTNDLRHALEREEFEIHYQPIVDITANRISGMEALIRWRHPGRGLIYPVEFIPLAEETGFIIPIGEWVLRNACAQNRKWQKAGYSFLKVAVNLSVLQLRHHNLVETVTGILHETGLDPRCLELEITESTVMQDLDYSIMMLQNLKDLGVRISLDDFGAGCSSLSYLKYFPLDNLKISQSFIHCLDKDQKDGAIVGSIIDMAHRLSLRTIAEGVETEKQIAFLRHHKCDCMQGNIFSKPLPARKFGEMLEKDKRLY